MPNSSPVSTESLSAVSALIGELSHGEATALDPSKPPHRAAIEAALAAAGRTADRYPALHAALGAGGGNGADSVIMVDKGKDGSGRATATIWQASGPDHLYSGGTLFALDGDSGALLALGHNSNVGDGFVPIGTDTASAQPASTALDILSVNHSVSQSGAVRFTALAGSTTMRGAALSSDMSGDANITVTQPTQTPENPPNVRIAVGRTSPGTDVDYYYDEPQNITSPYLIVPFLGEATLSYEIDGTLGQPIAGAVLQTQLYFVAGGTTYIMAMNATYTPNFAGRVTVDPTDAYTLHWSYPYDAGASYTNTTSIVYEPQSLVNEQISYFFYSFQIPVLDGPTPTVSFNVCSTDTPTEPTSQCFKVPNLWFWWHCLAAGTKVTLADGSGAAIEEIDNSYRVMTGEGGGRHLAVEATSRGDHRASCGDSPNHAVYRLVTDAGHELIGTGPHVVQTPSGLMPMNALVAGDTVATDNGTACVSSCEAIDFGGTFYNLKLGDAADRKEGLADDAVCTYVANGVVVGDHFAQRMEHRRLSRDMDHMKPLLPDALEADYASAVEDIRY